MFVAVYQCMADGGVCVVVAVYECMAGGGVCVWLLRCITISV